MEQQDEKHRRTALRPSSWRLEGLLIPVLRLQRLWSMSGRLWESPYVRTARIRIASWKAQPYSGTFALLFGTVLVSLLIAGINRIVVPLPNPGVVYLPLIAMLAYHWSWRRGAIASVLQLGCVYVFFLLPAGTLKPLGAQGTEQLVTLALVDAFILALVRLARSRRDAAEREAERFAALHTVGTALAGELDEQRLLQLIAQTARDLTGAGFAAFSLRPVDPLGHPAVPARGNLFHLAAVVGVTPEQEAVFRRIPLGGEGLLAPIFRQGVAVRVSDALALAHGAPTSTAPVHHADVDAPGEPGTPHVSSRDAARAQAVAFAHGDVDASALRGVGVPRGHPIVRSFLGAPLLDRNGQVRGGLLLGHTQPGRFSADDEMLLQALAGQAAVALENVRLYRAAQTQAHELDAVFESIAEGVSVVDAQGVVRHENRAAVAIRTGMSATEHADGDNGVTTDVQALVLRALDGAPGAATSLVVSDSGGGQREYLVSAAPLHAAADQQLSMTGGVGGVGGVGKADAGNAAAEQRVSGNFDASDASAVPGAVVVWHDMTETRQLLAEQQAHAQAETQRMLLQTVVDELPSGAYVVRGPEATLVLSNRAAMEVWGASWPVGMAMSAFLAESGTQIVGAGGQPLGMDELATVRAVRMGGAVRHFQEVIRRPDGTTLPVLLNAVLLHAGIFGGLLPSEQRRERPDGDETQPTPGTRLEGAEQVEGAESAALIVLQDVTALKEAERAKDEFIAIAAHELKTPMAAVKGYADMLLRQSARDEQAHLADWQTEALETIDQATSRLVELTNDLLDVTRIQAGRLELHLEPHDLVALARRVVKRFQVTTERHTLRIEVAGDAEFVVACLDVSRTEQVLGNLLSNAIKYSPDGGPITVGITENPRRGRATLRVQDPGIGIPERQQAHLFRRFERAENARERGIAGTGLGLYLCRELIERQGGHIWLTSAEGHGTTVSVTLRLAAE